MIDLHITKVELFERNAAFWCKMGPLFAGDEVKKELPYFSGKDYTWFLAEAQDKLAGCAAASTKGNVGELHHLWVKPECRGHGVGTALANARLDYLKDSGAKIVRATVREGCVPGLRKLGFTPLKRKGSYCLMQKNL